MVIESRTHSVGSLPMISASSQMAVDLHKGNNQLRTLLSCPTCHQPPGDMCIGVATREATVALDWLFRLSTGQTG